MGLKLQKHVLDCKAHTLGTVACWQEYDRPNTVCICNEHRNASTEIRIVVTTYAQSELALNSFLSLLTSPRVPVCEKAFRAAAVAAIITAILFHWQADRRFLRDFTNSVCCIPKAASCDELF